MYSYFLSLDQCTKAPPQRDSGDVKYVEKADYGKVPDYLKHVKSEIEQEKQAQHEAELQKLQALSKSKTALLAPEDREKVLSQLKAKHAEITRVFQGMTHLTVIDSLSKIKR